MNLDILNEELISKYKELKDIAEFIKIRLDKLENVNVIKLSDSSKYNMLETPSCDIYDIGEDIVEMGARLFKIFRRNVCIICNHRNGFLKHEKGIKVI